MRVGQLGGRRSARRPSVARRLARAVDVGITRVQEWLEGEDKPTALVVGYGIIVMAVVVTDDQKIINWLKDAYRLGISVDDLKDIALSVRTWTELRQKMESIIGF